MSEKCLISIVIPIDDYICILSCNAIVKLRDAKKLKKHMKKNKRKTYIYDTKYREHGTAEKIPYKYIEVEISTDPIIMDAYEKMHEFMGTCMSDLDFDIFYEDIMNDE